MASKLTITTHASMRGRGFKVSYNSDLRKGSLYVYSKEIKRTVPILKNDFNQICDIFEIEQGYQFQYFTGFALSPEISQEKVSIVHNMAGIYDE